MTDYSSRTRADQPAGRSRIADSGLAPSGHQAIEWARRHSPVLDGYVRSTLADGSLQGVRIAVVVHLEAKTAFLATVLADAGAHVVAAGSNPWSTRDDVAAALVDRGIEVHSRRGCTNEMWEADLLRVADSSPDYIIDDGAELTVRLARDRPALYQQVKGVSEETTTGVARLVGLDELGKLPMPVIAANDAALKHLFDNRLGTGQSTIQAILALTNLRLPGKQITVVGYGWVGRGIAAYAHALGARVTTVEVDPIRALEAHADGHDVADLMTALSTADIAITATGGVRAITARHFDALKTQVVLANAGHHDHEVDVPALVAAADAVDEVRPGVTRYQLGAKPVYLLSQGALVNIAGGLGHPVEIMDLSFSVQALACHHLVNSDLPPGLHRFPAELDRAIAVAKLASRNITLDAAIGDDRPRHRQRDPRRRHLPFLGSSMSAPAADTAVGRGMIDFAKGSCRRSKRQQRSSVPAAGWKDCGWVSPSLSSRRRRAWSRLLRLSAPTSPYSVHRTRPSRRLPPPWLPMESRSSPRRGVRRSDQRCFATHSSISTPNC